MVALSNGGACQGPDGRHMAFRNNLKWHMGSTGRQARVPSALLRSYGLTDLLDDVWVSGYHL